jgi:hypothetical protein
MHDVLFPIFKRHALPALERYGIKIDHTLRLRSSLRILGV